MQVCTSISPKLDRMWPTISASGLWRKKTGLMVKTAMAKVTSKQNQELELHPDAMERFERAVRVVAKSPPQHRVAKKKKKVAKAKKQKPV